MEACIVICRINKEPSRRGQVLFINAKNEVTRKNAQSYLEEDHIQKIAQTYTGFLEQDGFSAIATIDEVLQFGSKLSIPLYVKINGEIDSEKLYSLDEALDSWLSSSDTNRELYETLKYMLMDNGGERNG